MLGVKRGANILLRISECPTMSCILDGEMKRDRGLTVMTFGDRLRNLRQKANMTQKEVAEKLGITESAYGYYEQGRREPPQEAYKVLAQLFDVTLDYLILGTSGGSTSGVSTEEAEFLKWVDENLESSFFYDFDRSPEQSKAQLMEDLRYLWEREKKQRDRDKGKREE